MGSGKTTIGKELAFRLKIPFIDSDVAIEQQTGLSVGEIFGKFGEAYFRELETNFISNLSFKDSFVLATGGGMPCFHDNIDKLNQLGTTIYLERSPEDLLEHLKKAKNHRPLIDGISEEDLLDFITYKLDERQRYYKKAQIILDKEEQTVEYVLKIMEDLNMILSSN